MDDAAELLLELLDQFEGSFADPAQFKSLKSLLSKCLDTPIISMSYMQKSLVYSEVHSNLKHHTVANPHNRFSFVAAINQTYTHLQINQIEDIEATLDVQFEIGGKKASKEQKVELRATCAFSIIAHLAGLCKYSIATNTGKLMDIVDFWQNNKIPHKAPFGCNLPELKTDVRRNLQYCTVVSFRHQDKFFCQLGPGQPSPTCKAA